MNRDIIAIEPGKRSGKPCIRGGSRDPQHPERVEG
jgi:uncharacterized protein (DUF433 family)